MNLARLAASLGLALAAPACRAGLPTRAPIRPVGPSSAVARPVPVAASARRPQEPEKRAPARAGIGKPAPEFELKDLDGRTVKLSAFKGRTVVLEWFNPTCPYCVQAHGTKGALRTLPEELTARGIAWLTIVSEKPEDAGGKPQAIREFRDAQGMKAPILLDPTGAVGRAYEAKTTPHLYVIGEKGVLVYRGALDNAPMGRVAGDGPRENFVQAALADLRSGHAVTKAETKPYGWSIQYARP